MTEFEQTMAYLVIVVLAWLGMLAAVAWFHRK